MAGLGLLGETPEGEMLREDDPVGFLNDEPGSISHIHIINPGLSRTGLIQGPMGGGPVRVGAAPPFADKPPPITAPNKGAPAAPPVTPNYAVGEEAHPAAIPQRLPTSKKAPAASVAPIYQPEHAEAVAAAQAAAGGEAPLTGLPQGALSMGKDQGHYVPGPSAAARKVAADYVKQAGLPYEPPTDYAKVDPERATRIAAEYDKMPHAPNDPHVAASYDAMIKETMAQWRAIQKTGLKVEFIPPDAPNPYAHSPRMAMKDIRDNGHLWVYPTSTGFGTSQADISGNPLLRNVGVKISGKPATANDIFRIVHDYFGHYKEGVGFRADGEENAWRSHSAMYSPLARRAMTAETRGQNSWVNYGPHGEKNRTATDNTIYADQKSGIMPEWVHSEGAKTAPAIVGIKALKTTPKNYKAAATLIRHYPNMPEEIAKHGTDEEVINHFHNHVVDNLLALHDLVHKAGWADRAKLWYAGGNAIVKHMAGIYGLPDHSIAGAIAALSPQKDWFQNVSLAHRVIHTLKGNGDNFYHGYALDAKMEKTFRGLKAFQKKATKAIFNQIKGKSLGDIDKMDLKPDAKAIYKAMWIRLHDEAHNSNSYHILTPEGGVGRKATTRAGDPRSMAWGSLKEIAKAVRSVTDAHDDPKLMSKLMGERHKVRNFFNNLLDPYSPHGDVTIDTHAVAAALWRSLSGNSPEVSHNFGNSISAKQRAKALKEGYLPEALGNSASSAATGVRGLYPIYADAYRTAASMRGILPREMQSITWEGVRSLFPDKWKKGANNAKLHAIWNQYRKGAITQEQARDQVYEARGRKLPSPDWHGGG